MSEEKSFSDLFEASQQVNMSMKKGDKVSGEIIDIQKDTIFVDLGGRQDGIVDAKDFTDPEGNLTVKVGDTIEAFVGDSTANGIQLRRQCFVMGQDQGWPPDVIDDLRHRKCLARTGNPQ